jgi:hypothetical protein
MSQIEQRLRRLEKLLSESQYDARHIVRSELYHRERLDMQPEAVPHMISALCVNTIDPMAEGQVQFYTPFVTGPGVQVKDLPWAYPVSPFGGFDDSGVTWVPPAGSKLALLCENGDIHHCYYIGTFWTGTRGVNPGTNQGSIAEQDIGDMPSEDNNRLDVWGYHIPEYDCVWEGTRDGYNLGSNDGDQVKQPWNTDNVQAKDWDTQDDFDPNPESNQFMTYPHIYGWKTPGKHYAKYQDGDHKCNEKWSRVEHASGRGNIFMMKDDHLHPAAQWAFNGDSGVDLSECHSPMEDFSDCTDPNETSECDGEESNQEISKEEFGNPFYKRKEEMRFYQAPKSLAQYQNPKCELPQSGFQLQSLSGIQFVADDSVDQPQGVPNWKLDFDWGCNDVAKCKVFIRSATGHYIGANDTEDDTLIRGELNGIRISTAGSNKILMSDHTLGEKGEPTEAGDKRGIFIESTSKHVLEMHDEGNKQHSLPRQHPPIDPETGDQENISDAKADKAYVLLRSGYGLQLRMEDASSQEETQNQYLQLLAPQKDNEERGPHMMVMQEQPEGPGLVLMRAGGVYYINSYDDSIEVVGDENNPIPANKFVQVMGDYIVDVNNYYFNHNKLTIFQSETYIVLFAGRDCNDPQAEAESAGQAANDNVQIAMQSNDLGVPNQLPLNKRPCLHPVVTGADPWVCPVTGFVHFGVIADPADPTRLLHNSLSDRVFASKSKDKNPENIEV